jgi:2'-5' RNA ligase
MIRLFTAIEIPEAIRTRLTFLQGGIPSARWSPVENFHLTLRFIGEVSETTASDIDGVLEGLNGQGFTLTLKGVGEFGGRDPRALWVGVAPSEPLMRLAAKIESALQRMGLEAETRKYSPHVTLARLRDAPIGKVREFLAAHAMFESTPFAVREFALFSSHMRAGGSQYQVERTYELR